MTESPEWWDAYHPKKGRSNRHDQLAGKALTWFASRCTRRGARGGFELSLNNGYVADAVALGSFQYRFHQAYKCHWGYGREFKWNYFLCTFEAKASRGDFQGTFGPKATNGNHANRWEPITHLHWIVVSKGICTPEEGPGFWGILEEAGQGLREIRCPAFNELTEQALDRFAHSLLWVKSIRTWKHGSVVPKQIRIPNL